MNFMMLQEAPEGFYGIPGRFQKDFSKAHGVSVGFMKFLEHFKGF